MAPDDADVEAAMGVYLRGALPCLAGLERSPANRVAAALQARWRRAARVGLVK